MLHNVLNVPDLDISLYSVKQHMKIQGCFEHCENSTCTLAYPTFVIKVTTGNEITFDVKKLILPANKPSFINAEATMKVKPQCIPYTFTNTKHDNTIKISSIYKTKPLMHVPTKSTTNSAGYGLFSAVNTSIPPQSRKAVSLGFSITIPPGLYGWIALRSGLVLKHNIDVAAGVTDPNYRGKSK